MANTNKKKFSSTKSSKADAKWIKNAMKSIGSATLETFKEMAPTMSETAGGVSSTVKDVRNLLKTTKSQTTGLADNKYIKVAKRTVNYALEDLKNGNFNNTDRAVDLMMNGADDDSGGMFADYADEDDTSVTFNYVDNSSEDSNVQIEDASIRVTNAINGSAQASMTAAKATIDAMVSVTEAGLMQSQRIGNKAIEHLSNIENTLSSMLAYQQESTTQFYDAVIASFNKIGATMEENDYSSEPRISSSDLLKTKGGIDIGKYKQYVKQQFKELTSSSNAGMVGGMLSDMLSDDNTLNAMISNPIGEGTKFIIRGITPALVKGTIENVEETFKDFMPTMLARLGDWRNDAETGWIGNLKKALGSIFGINLDDKGSFELSGKITKDTAVFDGVTRNAIVEVIPKYLRESTGYLKAIAEHMKIDTKATIDSNDVFDIQNNRYVKLSSIKKDIANELDTSQHSDYVYSKFGSGVLAGGSEFKGSQKESYENIANQLFTLITRNAKTLKPSDMNLENGDSEIHKLLEQIEIRDKRDSKSQEVLLETLKSMQENGIGNDITSAQLRSRANYNNTIKGLSDNYDIRNLVAARIDDDTDVEAFIDDVLGHKKLSAQRKKALKSKNQQKKADRKEEDKENRRANLYRSAKDIATSGLKNTGKIEDETTSNDVKFQSNASVDNVVDAFANAGGHAKKGMIALMNGADAKTVVGEFGKIFTDNMKGLWGSFKDNFIAPLGEKLFGKKGEDGYKEDGLLAGSQNKIKEAWHAVTLRLTGKAYKDAEGNVHTEESEGIKSTVSIVKDTMGKIGESIRYRLFGDKKEDDGEETKKKPGVVNGLVDSLKEGLAGWKTALFGEDEKSVEESVENIKKNAMEALPEAGVGAIAGGLAGGLAGGSLLGTLVGGPVGGAIVGMGLSFAKRSKTFQDYVFGPEIEDEKGNKKRIGGLVSQKTQELFKNPELKKSMVGGAALGLAKNVVLGSSGGLLGSLVGGPIAGMALGAGIGMLRKSEMFQTFLYGDPEKGKTGLIQHFKNIFKGNKSTDDTDTKDAKKHLGMGIIGAAGGGITAALVGKVGLMGAMLTPAGPLGGAVLGAAVGLSAGSKKFQKWLFGEKDEETGKRKGGMVGKLGNFMHVEVMMPLKDKLISVGDDLKNVIEHKVLDTVRITIEPIGTAIKDTIDNAKNFVLGKFKDAGKAIKENVMDPFLTLMSNMLAPVKKAMSAITNVAMTATKTILTFPFKVMRTAANIITSPFRKLAKTLNNKFVKPLVGGVVKLIGSITKGVFNLATAPLKAAAAASTVTRQKIGDKFAGLGKDRTPKDRRDNGTYRDERRRSDKEYNDQKKLNRQKKRERENATKNRQKMAKILGYDEKYFTEETANAALEKINANKKFYQRKKKLNDIFVGGKNMTYDIDPAAEARKQMEALKEKSNDDLIKNADGKGESIEIRSLQEETKIRTGIDALVQHFTGNDIFGKASKKQNKDNESKKDNKKNYDADISEDETIDNKNDDTKSDVQSLVDEMNEAGGVFKWVKGKASNAFKSVKEDASADFNNIKDKFNDIKDKFSRKGQARAKGGNVDANKPYLVGDGGKDPSAAEIVVPKTAGKVLSQKGDGIKVVIDGFGAKIQKFFEKFKGEVKESNEDVVKAVEKSSPIDKAKDVNASLKNMAGNASSAFSGIDLSSMDAASRKAVYRNAKKRGINIGHLSDDVINGEKKKNVALDIAGTNNDKKKAASYEGQKVAKQAALEKLEDKQLKEQIAANTKETAEISKKSLWEWLKIFGKGGLIVAAAIKLYPTIKKVLNWFSDPLGKLLDNIKVDLGFGLDNLKDGLSVIDNLKEQVSNLVTPVVDFFEHPTHVFKDLKKVLFGQDDDGDGAEVDYSTGSKLNYARSAVKHQTKKATGIKKIVDKIFGREQKVKDKKATKKVNRRNKRKANFKHHTNNIKKQLGLNYDKSIDLDKFSDEELERYFGTADKDEIVKTYKDANWDDLMGEMDDAVKGDKKSNSKFSKLKEKFGKKGSKKAGSEAAEKATKEVTEEAVEKGADKITKPKSMMTKIKDTFTRKGSKKAGAEVAEKATKEGAEEAVEQATKKTTTKAATKAGAGAKKGLISKVIGYIDDGINFIFKKCGGKLAEKGTKEGAEQALKAGAKKGFKTTLTKVTTTLTKYFPRIMPKVVAILSSAGALVGSGVLAVVQVAKSAGWTVMSAINEATNPRRLFQIPAKEKPDWIMYAIAAAIGGLKGLDPVGPIIDIVDSLIASVLGFSFLTELAVFMYDCLVKFFGMGDKSAKLKENREKQKENYTKYKDSKNKKEYQSYLKSQGKSADDYSYEQYQKDVDSGKVAGAKVDSFIDYNAKENKTVGTKLGDTVLKIGDKIGDAGKKFLGYTENGYYDSKTGIFYFPTDSDGIWEMFKSDKVDKNGNPTGKMTSLGKINEKNMPNKKSMTPVKKEHKGLKDVKIVADVANFAKKHFGKSFDKFKDNAKDLGKNTKAGWEQMKDGHVVKGLGTVVGGAAKFFGKNAANTVTTAVGIGKDLAKNAFNGAKDLGKKAGKAALNFLTSEKTTGYLAKDGTWYDGQGQHYSSNNTKMDKISLEQLSELIKTGQVSETEITTRESGATKVFKTAFKFTKKAWKGIGDGVVAIGKGLSKAGKALKDTVGGALNTAGKAVGSFLFGKKESYWVDKDGSTYKVENKKIIHYSAAGDKIGEIEKKDFQTLVKSGQLKFTEKQVETPGWQKALNSAGKFIKNGWNAAVKGISKLGSNLHKRASTIGKNVIKVGAKVAKSGLSFLFGKEKAWFEENGSYYIKNGEKILHYTASGDKIGEVSEEDFNKLVSAGMLKEGTKINKPSWKNFTKSMGKKVSSAWNKAKNAVSGLWNKTKKTAGKIASEIKEKGVIGFVGGLFTDKKDKVWYDTDGNYYKLEKDGTYTHYNVNGDVLKEKIEAERIDEMKTAGTITEGDLIEDSAAKKAVKKIGDSVKEAWDKAKDTVTNAWDGFKNLIGVGGNGGFEKETGETSGGNGGFGDKIRSVVSNLKNSKNNNAGGFGDNVNNYPYYSQKDPKWAGVDYSANGSKGTMGDAGCGPTAMAMVASKYTGNKKDPVSIAKDAKANGFRDNTGTNSKFIDAESTQLGLHSSKKAKPTADYILDNVGNGKSMIINGVKTSDGSPFTKSGHYVVAVGKDKNGNVLVNDPRGKQYSKAIPAENIARDSRISWTYDGSSGKGGYGEHIIKSIFEKIGGKGGNKYTAEDVLKVALAEEGYLEKASANNLNDKTKNPGSSNHTKYEKEVFGSSGNYWCASFVSWCHYIAANKNKSAATKVLGILSMSADAIRQTHIKQKRYSKTPQPGDCIYFSGTRHAGANHIGIVYKVDSNKVYTIEGNTSSGSGVADNGGAVAKKSYSLNDSRILGYGHPNYDGSSDFSGDTSSSDSSSSSSSSSSESSDALSTVSDIFSQYATKATNGMLKGEWNMDFNSSTDSDTSSSDSSSSSSSSNTDSIEVKGSSAAKKIWNYFKELGYSEAAIAGILGNAQQESGINPAAGKNGGVAHGIFQWESSRFEALKKKAAKLGKPWYTIEPQIKYLASELEDPNIAYFNKSATYGSNVGHGAAGKTNWEVAGTSKVSFDDFKKSNDPDSAARQFEAAVERASMPLIEKRVGYAKGWYKKYASGGKGGYGYGGFGDNASCKDINYPSGGFGDSETMNMLGLTKKDMSLKKADIGGNGDNNILRNEANTSKTTQLKTITTKNSVSTNSKIEALLESVCELLSSIDSTASSSRKILKNLQPSSTTNNVVVSGNGDTSTTTTKKTKTTSSQTEKLQSGSSSTNAALAAKLAKG